jgi:hypothetical protein
MPAFFAVRRRRRIMPRRAFLRPVTAARVLSRIQELPRTSVSSIATTASVRSATAEPT